MIQVFYSRLLSVIQSTWSNTLQNIYVYVRDEQKSSWPHPLTHPCEDQGHPRPRAPRRVATTDNPRRDVYAAVAVGCLREKSGPTELVPPRRLAMDRQGIWWFIVLETSADVLLLHGCLDRPLDVVYGLMLLLVGKQRPQTASRRTIDTRGTSLITRMDVIFFFYLFFYLFIIFFFYVRNVLQMSVHIEYIQGLMRVLNHLLSATRLLCTPRNFARRSKFLWKTIFFVLRLPLRYF